MFGEPLFGAGVISINLGAQLLVYKKLIRILTVVTFKRLKKCARTQFGEACLLFDSDKKCFSCKAVNDWELGPFWLYSGAPAFSFRSFFSQLVMTDESKVTPLQLFVYHSLTHLSSLHFCAFTQPGDSSFPPPLFKIVPIFHVSCFLILGSPVEAPV